MVEFRKIKQPKELWQIFSLECIEHTAALETFIESTTPFEEDPESERKLSNRLHRLRGSLGFIGFTELTLDTKKTEALLKSKDTALKSELKILANKISELNFELKALLDN